MRALVGSVVGSMGALQFTEWVHDTAGVLGDMALIAASLSALVVVGRRVMRKWRRVLTLVETVAEQTEVVPEIASKLDRHIVETRDALEDGAQKFERIEGALRCLGAPPPAGTR